MARGIGRSSYIAGKDVVKEDEGGWDFLYVTSTTKPAKKDIGDRVVLPDGRVWRLGLSGAACPGGFGAAFWRPFTFNGGTSGQAEIGDRSVKITLDAGAITAYGADIPVDGFRGGYYSQPDATTPQTRAYIVGNTGGASGAVITLYLDAPLTRQLITNSFSEVLANPYGDLRGTAGGEHYVSFAGLPATTVSAASMYFWVQTWGPTWITPNQPVGDAVNRRDVYFHPSGSVISGGDITVETGWQKAGFIIDRTGAAADNPPYIMLQISP